MIRKLGVQKVSVDSIVVGRRWRKPQAGKIAEIRASLRENGQIDPLACSLLMGRPQRVRGSSFTAPLDLRPPSLRAGLKSTPKFSRAPKSIWRRLNSSRTSIAAN
jgi:hypothetical protein